MDVVLPAKWRKIAYLAFGLLGLANGALYVGYSSLEAQTPAWLTAGSAVLAFVSTAPFVLAVLNVTSLPVTMAPSDPVVPPDVTDEDAQ